MPWLDDVLEVEEPARPAVEVTDEHRRAVLRELWSEAGAGLVPLHLALREYESRLKERTRE